MRLKRLVRHLCLNTMNSLLQIGVDFSTKEEASIKIMKIPLLPLLLPRDMVEVNFTRVNRTGTLTDSKLTKHDYKKSKDSISVVKCQKI